MRTTCMIALVMYSCLAGRAASAQESGYSDAEVKAQFVEAGMFCHAEFIRRGYRRAFEMAGCDTNRYARILRELAVENTNETEWAIASLGKYKTRESLPFLYSYATNAVYGAKALKAVFAIDGVNSNSITAIQNYLLLTNSLPNNLSHDRSELCNGLLHEVFATQELVPFRAGCLSMMIDFAQTRNSGHIRIDDSIQSVDPSYRFSKRRLAVLRSAQNRCANAYQFAYVTNAINELVAYPEANLPD
ncbi:MAG: hypothetical protein IKQ17_11190 [Kiritimatiellae bacterium]|nr:hypothetical protein [Kiritimatiellia bacterium]